MPAERVFGPWIDDIDCQVAEFRSAVPFPHVVIDDFLCHDLASDLLGEFPLIDAMPHSRDYMFGNKHELSSIDRAGSASAAFATAVKGEEFAAVLSKLTGREVFVDPQFHGGGFHQGAHGSFLDMHVDFNIHPQHENWHRMINCLLYLNPDWQTDYGGELLIKDRPDAEPVAIAPLFNRAVIMVTDHRTFHGYRKMTLPAGVTRKSIATYAYEQIEAGSIKSRTTGWKPESPSLLKRLAASQYDTAVKVKNRFFGSGTASNR